MCNTCIRIGPEARIAEVEEEMKLPEPPGTGLETPFEKYPTFNPATDANFRAKGQIVSEDEKTYRGAKDRRSKMRRAALLDTLQRMDGPNALANMNAAARRNVSRWSENKTPPSRRIEVFPGDWGDVVQQCTIKSGVTYAAQNMAKAYGPGGGNTDGMVAQEENMFRRTSCHFYVSLCHMDPYRELYRKEMTDLIEAKQGEVYLDMKHIRVCIKGNEAEGYPLLSEDMIFPFFELRAAADDLRGGVGFSQENCRRKIYAQLNTLKNNGVTHVVLSAFGCGAFRNPAVKVAMTYKEALEEPMFADFFVHVVFAIHAGYGPDNFTPFKAILDPS
jgi:hypothetical protein